MGRRGQLPDDSVGPPRRRATLAAWALLLLVLAADTAFGQAAPAARPRPGAEVRIETIDGRRIQGRLTRSAPTSLVLVDLQGEVHDVPRGDVIRMWTKVPNTERYAGRGAFAGALGFGGYLALLAGGLCEETSCGDQYVEGLLVGAPLGALGGAAFGARLGSLTDRWQPLDPASTGSRPEPASGWRLHLGASRGAEENGPAPAALARAAVDRTLAPTRRVFLELAYVAYRTDRLERPGPFPGVDRNAGTLSVALGLTQELGPDGQLRLNASGGFARSSLQYVPVDPDRPGGLEGTVRYGSQLSASVEAGWAPGFAPDTRVGLEARYDHLPLFLDGVHILTLSAAVWS